MTKGLWMLTAPGQVFMGISQLGFYAPSVWAILLIRMIWVWGLDLSWMTLSLQLWPWVKRKLSLLCLVQWIDFFMEEAVRSLAPSVTWVSFHLQWNYNPGARLCNMCPFNWIHWRNIAMPNSTHISHLSSEHTLGTQVCLSLFFPVQIVI